MRFEIIHEETTDDTLVLRELNGSPQTAGSQAILRIDRSERSMVRIATSRGQSIVTNYCHTTRPAEP